VDRTGKLQAYRTRVKASGSRFDAPRAVGSADSRAPETGPARKSRERGDLRAAVEALAEPGTGLPCVEQGQSLGVDVGGASSGPRHVNAIRLLRLRKSG